MSVSRIEYELPVDDQGRDAALLGFNVDGEMRWTIEAGRHSSDDLQQVENLTTDQLRGLLRCFGNFVDGRL